MQVLGVQVPPAMEWNFAWYNLKEMSLNAMTMYCLKAYLIPTNIILVDIP